MRIAVTLPLLSMLALGCWQPQPTPVAATATPVVVRVSATPEAAETIDAQAQVFTAEQTIVPTPTAMQTATAHPTATPTPTAIPPATPAPSLTPPTTSIIAPTETPVPTTTALPMPTFATPLTATPLPTVIPISSPTPAPTAPSLPPPPAALHLDPFYEKYLDADGIPVVASGDVTDVALFQAHDLIDEMLANRQDIRTAMAVSGVRVAVMLESSVLTDLPGIQRPEEVLSRRALG